METPEAVAASLMLVPQNPRNELGADPVEVEADVVPGLTRFGIHSEAGGGNFVENRSAVDNIPVFHFGRAYQPAGIVTRF